MEKKLTIDFANVKKKSIEISEGGKCVLTIEAYKDKEPYDLEGATVLCEHRPHGKYHASGLCTQYFPRSEGNVFRITIEPRVTKTPKYLDCFVICGEDEFPFLIDIVEEQNADNQS